MPSEASIRQVVAAAVATLFLFGCRSTPPAPSEVRVAPGILLRRDDLAGIQILDVDLRTARVRPAVLSARIARKGHNFIGDARTVAEWVDGSGALAGINGGFFGDTYDTVGRRKQIVQLSVRDGVVVTPGSALRSRATGERYLRAAIGFRADGRPEIVWALGTRRSGPERSPTPLLTRAPRPWPVVSAVACGPRLLQGGALAVTDREERLRSPGTPARAFIAYDNDRGRPRHLVLGRSDGAEYATLARYLQAYFPRHHRTSPGDAMCLDGGPSAQLAYRSQGRVIDATPTGVLVPTAIVLLPDKKEGVR